VVLAAKLMMNAALTAPVTGGMPQIEGELIYGEDEQEALARQMEELAHEIPTSPNWEHIFLYEAVMAREADAILLIGNTRAHRTPWDGDCGACGGSGCEYVYERHKQSRGIIDTTVPRSGTTVAGPVCALYAHNTGYAVGSALMTAVRLYVDARPFMSMGVAARKLGYCPNSEVVVAVAAAARQKHEFRDPGTDYHIINLATGVDALRKHVSQSGLRPASGLDYRGFNPGKLQ